MKTLKHATVALNLPQIVGLIIVHGRHVIQAMTQNVWFPTPSPTLAVVEADLDALETDEALAHGRALGAVAARDLKRKAVEDDLHSLKAYVQGIANQNPLQAQLIIASAGMSLKQFTPHQRPDLEAMKGPHPGEVVVRAKAVARAAAYEWQYSADGGVTWVATAITTVANVSILGLTVHQTYSFRFRTTVKQTTSDWSQVVTFFLN